MPKKGIIIVVNKWDLNKEITHPFNTIESFSALVRSSFEFLPFTPLVFVSSVTGKNINNVLELVSGIVEQRTKTIPTPKLNSLLREITLKRPPIGEGKGELKLLYVTQTDINPPTFTFFTNRETKVHFSYRRYIENRIREEWGFAGTPIKLTFKKKT